MTTTELSRRALLRGSAAFGAAGAVALMLPRLTCVARRDRVGWWYRRRECSAPVRALIRPNSDDSAVSSPDSVHRHDRPAGRSGDDPGGLRRRGRILAVLAVPPRSAVAPSDPVAAGPAVAAGTLVRADRSADAPVDRVAAAPVPGRTDRDGDAGTDRHGDAHPDRDCDAAHPDGHGDCRAGPHRDGRPDPHSDADTFADTFASGDNEGACVIESDGDRDDTGAIRQPRPGFG
jgi:hypothetical protein